MAGKRAPANPGRVLALAENYAAALADLESRAEENTVVVLRRSLAGTLTDLRKAYSDYTGVLGTETTTDPNGNIVRRPGSYSAAEASAKFRGILEASRGFLTPKERKEWEGRFGTDLQDAVAAGGAAAKGLIELVAPGKGKPFTGPAPGVLKAAVTTASAYIEGESQKFRDQIVAIVGQGAMQGWGPTKMTAQVRLALEGVAADPKGLNAKMGLNQRAALIARSELQNVYATAAKEQMLKDGYAYARWIATESERTCKYCAARHGRIFPLQSIVIPAHPRCRCSFAPVSSDAVEEENEAIRDTLLDGEFWRDQQAAVATEYTKARGVEPEKAQAELAAALALPTASERRRFPTIQKSLPESAPLSPPSGGQTFEQAIQERERIAAARKALQAQQEADDKDLQLVLETIPTALREDVKRGWAKMTAAEKAKAVAEAKELRKRKRGKT